MTYHVYRVNYNKAAKTAKKRWMMAEVVYIVAESWGAMVRKLEHMPNVMPFVSQIEDAGKAHGVDVA